MYGNATSQALTCFKMTNAPSPALLAFELVHVAVQQSGIRNQRRRCRQKLAAAAGYFYPISIHRLQGRRNQCYRCHRGEPTCR